MRYKTRRVQLVFKNISLFPATKALSHQEKKERKERDLCWPTMHSFMWLPTALTGFQNRFGLCEIHVHCWDCMLEISEPTVVIAQTGSVSCVAHRGPWLNCYWLLRKRQFMDGRKCIAGWQRSLCERFEPRSQFKSRLSLIIEVNVVPNRTVVEDSDWHFQPVR